MARPKRRRHDDPESTAYHEAGHAAIAVHFGRKVHGVSIVPVEDTLGHCRHTVPGAWFHPDYDTSPRARRAIEDWVMILFAGFHAETHFAGWRNHVGASSDMRRAVDLLSYLACGEELDKYLAWLNVRSKNLVEWELNWRPIECIARELMERREISGHDVRRLFWQARRDFMTEKTGTPTPMIGVAAKDASGK
jgi:hypothetical protein